MIGENMSTVIQDIKRCIESQLEIGNRNFVIFPYGKIGMQIENILEKVYGISPIGIFDNSLYKYNPKIKPLNFIKEIKTEYSVILASTNEKIYPELKSCL